MKKRVVVLGSTGSIGVNALDVIRSLPDRLEAVGLCAHANAAALGEQIRAFRPRWAVLADPAAAAAVEPQWLGKTQLLTGPEGVEAMVRDPQVDIVLVAIVGAAGLLGTWHAVQAGKTVAVANKETLVMAGQLVTELAARAGARILPVDSEHSAIFQIVEGKRSEEIERIVLTASGGPFRGWKKPQLEGATVEQALRHPTWKMGPKITIDSATLMNKALEVIEARWLFGLAPGQIEVVIHPESMIHSFVEFRDGSVLAQMSPPDMRLPIQLALTYPDRVPGPARRLDWNSLRALTFEKPDQDSFPALQLGYEVARRGGTSGAVLNAANEAAVEAFLQGKLGFLDIPRVCGKVMEAHAFRAGPTLAELMAADAWARKEVARWLAGSSETH